MQLEKIIMANKKLIYDLQTLSIKKDQKSIVQYLIKIIPHTVIAMIFSAIFITIFYYFYDSPEEILLKRENHQYAQQIFLFNKKLDNVEKILSNLAFRDDNIYRSIFDVDPIPDAIRQSGFGGSNRYENLEGYDNSKLIINVAKRIDKVTKEMYVQSKSYDKVIYLLNNKEKMLQSVPSIQPILNKQLTHIASYFGYRTDPVYGVRKHHDGIDFTAHTGTPIHATGNGVVVKAENSNGGYGNEIEIDHGFSYKSKYAHLSKILVTVGQKVKRGQIIGLVGNTGKSTGPHLHYEVRRNDVPINPINFFFMDLSPEEYDRMIELSSMPGGKSLD